MKTEIEFEDFEKLDLRIGKVVSAEIVEGADKLLRLSVDFGDDIRDVMAGIRQRLENEKLFGLTPDDLVGHNLLFLINLKPRKIKGVLSQAMILVDRSGIPLMTLYGDGQIGEVK